MCFVLFVCFLFAARSGKQRTKHKSKSRTPLKQDRKHTILKVTSHSAFKVRGPDGRFKKKHGKQTGRHSRKHRENTSHSETAQANMQAHKRNHKRRNDNDTEVSVDLNVQGQTQKNNQKTKPKPQVLCVVSVCMRCVFLYVPLCLF